MMRRVGAEVAYRASADLLALHVPFGCLDDDHLPAISPATRLLIYPCPFTLSDDTFEQLRAWVDQGGTLLLTGDMSYDADRRLTREDRLTALAGVRMVGRNYEHIRRDRGTDRRAQFELGDSWEGVVRPCGSVEAVTADVLGRDEQGIPVLVRNRVGQGRVYYCTDPFELASDAPAAALRRALYRAVAQDCGVSPLAIEPDVPWLHVLEQPTAQGRAQVVFHTLQDASPLQIGVRSATGQVQLGIRPGWPALAVTTTDGTSRDHQYVWRRGSRRPGHLSRPRPENRPVARRCGSSAIARVAGGAFGYRIDRIAHAAGRVRGGCGRLCGGGLDRGRNDFPGSVGLAAGHRSGPCHDVDSRLSRRAAAAVGSAPGDTAAPSRSTGGLLRQTVRTLWALVLGLSGRGGFGHEPIPRVPNGQEVPGIGRILFERLPQSTDELVGSACWTWPCMPHTFSSNSCRGITRPSCWMKYCRSFISSCVMRIGNTGTRGLERLEVHIRCAEFEVMRSAVDHRSGADNATADCARG